MNDAERWRAIQSGDAPEYTRFYRETAPRLIAYLCRIVGSQEAAQDVAQEIYTHIWQTHAGYDPQRGALLTWLYGIARNRARDWWRRYQPQEENLPECVDPQRTESATMMMDLLHQLPEEQRSLLWLREVEGQSYDELAVILRIPVGTVRSRLFTAREALRKIWFSSKGRAQ